MSEQVVVGSIVDGKIIRIKPFGAIVAINGDVNGLVHISHISSKFVQDINEYVNIGDEVKVKVLSIDETTKKVSLSMKDAEPPSEAKPQAPRERKPFNNGPRNFDKHEPASTDPKDIFEDRFKDFLKTSNERQAELNKRNKRR